MEQQKLKELSNRWTKEILERCTPRELLVIVAAYGAAQVAKRMGCNDILKFIEETSHGHVPRPS